MGPGEGAQVEAGHHVVGQPDQVRAEPVAAGLGQVLHVAARDQRGQQARNRAGVDAGAPRQLVGAHLAGLLEERIQHAKRALDRLQAALGGSSGGRHFRIVAYTRPRWEGQR